MKGIAFPWPVATMILQHHERLDGSGYPGGLVGEEILLGARIIAVADVVEAMSSHRPYRPALGIEVALKEIEDGSGTRYDSAWMRINPQLPMPGPRSSRLPAWRSPRQRRPQGWTISPGCGDNACQPP
jgi:hypothetical protein